LFKTSCKFEISKMVVFRFKNQREQCSTSLKPVLFGAFVLSFYLCLKFSGLECYIRSNILRLTRLGFWHEFLSSFVLWSTSFWHRWTSNWFCSLIVAVKEIESYLYQNNFFLEIYNFRSRNNKHWPKIVIVEANT